MPDGAIALVFLGVFAGVLSGMFGIGGGIVIVPILTAFFGFEFLTATGTSLSVLLLPVSVFAVIAYYRAGRLKIPVAAWVGAGIVFGSWIGANVALALPKGTLQVIYGVFLIYCAWRFIEPRKWLAARRAGTPAVTPDEAERKAPWYGLLFVGAFAGVASGLFGIGGGLVIVPFLVTLLHFEQKLAVGTSLGALLLPVSLPAVITYYNQDKIQLATAALIAVGLVGGAFIGARVALSLPSTTVKRLYGVFLLIMALRFIIQGLGI
jgi:uncharacterized membrane protein YfcA